MRLDGLAPAVAVHGETMLSVDEILDEYNLTRAAAATYVDAITRLNQTQTAEVVGVDVRTINQKHKKAFNAMSAAERAMVIASVMRDRTYDLLAERETAADPVVDGERDE